MKYGRNNYDFKEDTLVFISSRQIIKVKSKAATCTPKGWSSLFHPDLIIGTQLGKEIIKILLFPMTLMKPYIFLTTKNK